MQCLLLYQKNAIQHVHFTFQEFLAAIYVVRVRVRVWVRVRVKVRVMARF